jgi:cysteine dioxygenase
MAHTLDDLFRYLDGLTDRAPLHELTALLADLDVGCDDVADFVRFSAKRYARNALRSGTWYAAWVMCWRNGQRSPIHDHKGSSCGVRVLRGTATETLCEFAPNGHVKAVFSRDHYPGDVCGSEDTDLHQISNLQAGDADLVTLHVYSPPLIKMGTYSLEDGTRGEELMAMDFCDAAGI